MGAFLPQFFIQENSPRIMLALCNALVEADIEYLVRHPNTPLLYQSGVRYCLELPGKEHFCDIPTCIQRRKVDCEDLAAWRVAELQVRYGVAARIRVDSQPRKDGTYLHHIRVQHVDGSVEDPSAKLGMNDANVPCDAAAGWLTTVDRR